jgi:hypothetical protein
MSCSAFRKGWEIGGPEGHAASCATCAEWVAGQRRAATALAHLAAGLDGTVLSDDREPALRAAFRQARRPAPEPPVRRWLWTVAATAACFIVAAMVVPRGRPGAAPVAQVAAGTGRAKAPAPAVRKHSPRSTAAARPSTRPPVPPTHQDAPPREAPPAAPESEPPPVSAITTPAEPLPAEPVEEPGRATPATLADASAERAPGSDDRDFHPLVPGLEAAALESGQILRVQLRSDMLEAAGLPPRGGLRDPVEAEVLVGPDGVARGIRLAGPPPLSDPPRRRDRR